MKNYRVLGVVIHRFEIGEADRILKIFSRERGIISAKAKSVRKIKAKLKGALELFMLSKIDLAKGKSLDVITGAQIEESFSVFRTNLADTSVAFYLTESILGLLGEEEPHQRLFDQFLDTLKKLNKADLKDRKRDLLISQFLIQVLKETGFEPELQNCLSCHQSIKTGQNYFSVSQGGLVCSNCQAKFPDKKLINPQAIKLLRLISHNGQGVNQKIKAPAKYLNETREILHSFMEYQLEKEIKSKHFLKQTRE